MERMVNEKKYQKVLQNQTGRKIPISMPLNTRVGSDPTRESVTSRNTSRKVLPTRFPPTIVIHDEKLPGFPS